ncbi:hypothetical protein Taro_031636, partial [Colocasia esculenta]|nr:hypothetical protein [Colocasia esculenta]
MAGLPVGLLFPTGSLFLRLTPFPFSSMAPRRRRRKGVAEQATRQEVGDAPPPQQTQPLPQDAHSGIVPPPPPPPQAQALTWWSAEWETTFQSRPLRQIPWQEFVVSFERAFCPTYVRTERLYQFLDLQQRDSTVVQYRARFVELGRYAPQIMGDEGLRTQQFVRGLRPELRQALIVAHVTDLDAAYQTAAALEADTLRTRARRYCAGDPEDYDFLRVHFYWDDGESRDSSRLGVFSSRQDSLRSGYNVLLLVSVTGVTRCVIWREIVLCYLVCHSSRPSHSLECSSSRHLCSSVSRPE